jgi:hypothetical protein
MMKEHIRILELGARGTLPEEIDEHSDISISVVRELVEAQFLTAIDASSVDGVAYINPRITLAGRDYLRKLQNELLGPDSEIIALLERMRDIMIAVSTGGPRIDNVNTSYRNLYSNVEQEFKKRGLPFTNPFPDLWDWYGRWSSGDLPSYQSRRQFISELINPLIEEVRNHKTGIATQRFEPTGWVKVDRIVGEIRRRLAEAETEEQYQAVGLLCREAIISLAQAVYNPEKHLSIDGVQSSDTDAKRMLDSYISVELEGSSNEASRRHARASFDFANDLQHRRTASFRLAALCVEATSSLINVISIVSGRRDPSGS